MTTFADIFAGIGGFRLAFEAEGATGLRQRTRSVLPEDVSRKFWGQARRFDILAAGFACQPFSLAGISKKRSLERKTGFQDETQGTLFFDLCNILAQRKT